ncbi:MAG: hypothetical protein P0Y56_16180 [Candidatus Andeanibacterium colombiense]|uniref:Uncharacterized protein n=1 Tax=Candidatus Andeanibacterium colombiense TaxID=3121345 RepID=A0AAJ6BML6_9SPHN|nr:MAG: hypothetical protein P0Y56_16180 [Sphingomonadaceae bacterium]
MPGWARLTGSTRQRNLGFGAFCRRLAAGKPAPGEANKPLAVLRITGMTAVLLGAGATVYGLSRRGAKQQVAE